MIFFNLRSIFLYLFCFYLNAVPPKQIPAHFFNDFIMNGSIALEYMYFDGTVPSNAPVVFTKEKVDHYLEKIKQQETFYYGLTDSWLYRALEKYNISKQKVAIFGSFEPLYEAICLFYGGIPITIEYNKWVTNHPNLFCMTPQEYEENPMLFDCGFSISSFEHDGLGRYGDSINPWADLETMKKRKKMIKPNGLLFLAVPVGKDTVVWNAHRIYGKIRLPLLLKGWEIIDCFGISGLQDPIFNTNIKNHFIQPIFILKNISPNAE